MTRSHPPSTIVLRFIIGHINAHSKNYEDAAVAGYRLRLNCRAESAHLTGGWPGLGSPLKINHYNLQICMTLVNSPWPNDALQVSGLRLKIIKGGVGGVGSHMEAADM